MSTYQLTHHQIIESALKNFNAPFLQKHDIIFGGGTRIALELDEYRESIDIDFLCPNRNAYRTVRENVTNSSASIHKAGMGEGDYISPTPKTIERSRIVSHT